MGHGRPRTGIGTFGGFTFVSAPNGKVRARVRYRDDDGQLRLVQATGDSRKSAERALKARLSQRASYASGYGALSADGSFTTLVKVWLDDLDLLGKLAPSTRALYERNMRQLVMPVFEHYTLREITVRKVDQFIKTLAATKSYSVAKQARTVLSLAFGLAVRYDALRENPVRHSGQPQFGRCCRRVGGRCTLPHGRRRKSRLHRNIAGGVAPIDGGVAVLREPSRRPSRGP